MHLHAGVATFGFEGSTITFLVGYGGTMTCPLVQAAEALGAIGTGECVEFLQAYMDSSTVMLKESCQVALDVVDYWTGNEASASTDAAAAGAGAP